MHAKDYHYDHKANVSDPLANGCDYRTSGLGAYHLSKCVEIPHEKRCIFTLIVFKRVAFYGLPTHLHVVSIRTPLKLCY